MNDISIYHIRLEGQVDEGAINAGPFAIRVAPVDAAGTLLHVETDQSGLIGLLRYLHGRGVVFLSVERVPVPVTPVR